MNELEKLIELAKSVEQSAEDKARQRLSFAYGNTHFENERITRETVERAAARLAEDDGSKD